MPFHWFLIKKIRVNIKQIAELAIKPYDYLLEGHFREMFFFQC